MDKILEKENPKKVEQLKKRLINVTEEEHKLKLQRLDAVKEQREKLDEERRKLEEELGEQRKKLDEQRAKLDEERLDVSIPI